MDKIYGLLWDSMSSSEKIWTLLAMGPTLLFILPVGIVQRFLPQPQRAALEQFAHRVMCWCMPIFAHLDRLTREAITQAMSEARQDLDESAKLLEELDDVDYGDPCEHIRVYDAFIQCRLCGKDHEKRVYCRDCDWHKDVPVPSDRKCTCGAESPGIEAFDD